MEPGKVSLMISAQSSRITGDESGRPRSRCHVEHQRRRTLRCPIWVFPVLLSVLSLVVAGFISFELTQSNAEAALGRVGRSYRNLACSVVENEVVNYLGTLTTVTKQLALYTAESNFSIDAAPTDLRKHMSFSMAAFAGKGPTSMFLGTTNGEFMGIDTDVTSGALMWDLSNGMTGFHFGSFPATPVCNDSVETQKPSCIGDALWKDPYWLGRVGEISLTSQPYNATARLWFKAGAATNNAATFAPVYASLLPSVNTVGVRLAVASVAPVRSSSGELKAVAASECTVDHFDDFLKEISATLFEGTVAFLVEIDTGYLLASSITGQQMVSHF
eukprot:RCo047348